MRNHITPEQARELISRAEGYADSDYTTIDMLVDTNVNKLSRVAWDMARTLAGARTEYAIARKNGGVTEYLADWGWTDFRSTAEWHWSYPEHEPGPDEFIVSRLVIDIEEEA